MVFLIDGYNLMHAVGLAPAGGSLERARTRFLDWLADTAKGRPEVLRVVFDAQASSGASPEADHRGVRVLFAAGRTADELIEELVNAEPRPDRITVVSNDAQVREAGRRRGCGVLGCGEFVDRLLEASRERERPEERGPEKPTPGANPDEMAAWLAAFSAAPEKRQRRPGGGRR